mgnify:CR=1 FL=1|tara:strand:- start:1193 stop:1540 length:348 start_codon:yes stop_codon:yes gene_type:complete
MKTYITERFTFEAAHKLDGLDPANARIHGHSHEVFVTISGEPDRRYGWVITHSEIREQIAPVVASLDHQYLNDFIAQPTAEMIAEYIYTRINLGASIALESVKVCKVGMCAEVRG